LLAVNQLQDRAGERGLHNRGRERRPRYLSYTARAMEVIVGKEDRGFASMDRHKQREIASKGGKAAHEKGTAHEWSSDEARAAGRKGGMASHRRRLQTQDLSEPVPMGAEIPAADAPGLIDHA
jgi:general stress protein YciG